MRSRGTRSINCGLYGVLRPTSPARQSVYFPDLAEAWCGLLDLYIEERIETLGSAVSAPRLAVLRREADQFVNSYNYRTWALATAQHYGLPSVGLDLTSDTRIALYFALHRFHADPETGVMSVQRATEDDDPVLYGLDVFATTSSRTRTLRRRGCSAHDRRRKAPSFSLLLGATRSIGLPTASMLRCGLRTTPVGRARSRRPRRFPRRTRTTSSPSSSEQGTGFAICRWATSYGGSTSRPNEQDRTVGVSERNHRAGKEQKVLTELSYAPTSGAAIQRLDLPDWASKTRP
ncbi:FRG domain-containing protein [Rhizobium leguminosarum bv. viciae]|nr:FRG domain-containing protein [Rhizobium leguminosarum bv. viciae]